MNDIKISVIVPVYNIENYIEKTVESIRNQTHKNIEIILVDDGSTDNSGRIINAIADRDSRVKVVHQRNCGVTSARITGVNFATGDWIGFVDGDDFIEPTMYETLLKNAYKYQADISHCGYQMVFPSRVDYYYNTHKTVVQNHENGLYDIISGEFVEPGLWNKIYKSSVVKSVIDKNLIDISIVINEDLLMNYYFFKFAEVSVFYDICPYHYILRKGSAATSIINKNKLFDPIRVQKIILEDVENDRKLSDAVYGRLANCYLNGASMKNLDKEAYIDEYITMCKRELKNIKQFFFAGNRSKITLLKYNLCILAPACYRVFHKTYAKIKGTDNKYKVR